IDVDHVLIVLHQQTDGVRETGDGTILQVLFASSASLWIAVLVPDHVGLLENVRTGHRFHGLIGRAPERGPNLHGGDLTIARLPRIGLAHHLVFFREPGIKNPAEIHVAGMAAGPDDHTSFCPNIQRVTLIGGGYSENSSRKRLLSDDSG